ncbi:MAG: hypothetical protein H0X62_07500, partial [Bacteroidetes bacterium]|nr:hypothetical protein [Bacteroidota bacterium]
CVGCPPPPPYEDIRTTYIALEDEVVDQFGNFIKKEMWKIGVSGGNGDFLIRNESSPGLVMTKDGKASLFSESSANPSASLEITQASAMNHHLLRLRKVGKGYVFGINNNGAVKIGLGTSIPDLMLDVRGNGYFEGRLGIGTGAGNPEQMLDVRGNGYFSGNVGIGTSTPGAKLEIRGAGNQSIDIFTSTLGSRLTLMAVTSNGVRESQIQYAGGGRFGFVEIGHGFRMMIATNGNVGIGTNTPEHKLDVAGKIRACEVIVETRWCDFVFKSDYKLIPLQERQSFIKQFGHLPNIMSEKEVVEEGANLGQAITGILQNVEEHELYLHNQEEKINALQKEIDELKAEFNNLLKEIEILKTNFLD